MTSRKSQAIVFYVVDQGTEFVIEFAESARYRKAVEYLNAALGEPSVRTPESIGTAEAHPTYRLGSEQYREFKKLLG